MPIRRAVRITRQAISPRLAMRIFWNTFVSPRSRHISEQRWLTLVLVDLQRNVSVLAPRVLELLVAEHRQRAANPLPGVAGHDHVVDVPAPPRNKRIGELLAILFSQFGNAIRIIPLLAKDDLDRALGTHH